MVSLGCGALGHSPARFGPAGRVQTSFFFFQAEDGIRDVAVTGVQTCALPISDDERQERRLRFFLRRRRWWRRRLVVLLRREIEGLVVRPFAELGRSLLRSREIGRASWRERV